MTAYLSLPNPNILSLFHPHTNKSPLEVRAQEHSSNSNKIMILEILVEYLNKQS